MKCVKIQRKIGIAAKRLASAAFALVLVAGLLGTPAVWAAEPGDDGKPYDVSLDSLVYANGSKTGEQALLLPSGVGPLVGVITYKQKGLPVTDTDVNVTTDMPHTGFTITGGFKKADGSSGLSYAVTAYDATTTMATIQLVVTNINYTAASRGFRLANTSPTMVDKFPDGLSMQIPDEFFTKKNADNSGSIGTEEEPLKSDIVIENVIVTDANGRHLDKVTKDSDPFNISVIYADYGLKEVDVEDLPEGSLEVFLTNAGSFIPGGSNRGTLRTTVSTASDAPRFRAEFRNITWDGSSNSLAIQIRYSLWGEDFTGSANTVVYQAKAETKEGEDDDKPIDPPTPYIIVSQYSFGEGQIEAGTTFPLGLTFKNTSNTLPLENIVMTITTPPDLSIATASNTYYISSLGAGASMNYSIELEAKPNASVGSQSVQVAFSYQYLFNKERRNEKTTETVAIPVTQIDRFAVDPITEVPSGQIGEAAYISVGFINRGKTATYNISGFAKGNLEILSPAQHFGNLEAGRSDSIDITVVPQESGEMFGEVVIQYEDENTNHKEITVPFTMFIEAPYIPPPAMPETDHGHMPEEPQGMPPYRIILCVIGGLLIALPMMLYVGKTIKAKAENEFADDF